MKKLATILGVLLLLGVSVRAYADYAIKDGNSAAQTVYAFVCFTTKICPASTPVDSTGADMTDTTNHRLNTNANQAGTWSVQGSVSNASSGVATSATNVPVAAYLYQWNGTSWDQFKPNSNGITNPATSAPVVGAQWSTAYINALSTTVTSVKASAGNLQKVYCGNPNSSAAYLQVFNLATASVTLGTTTPTQSYYCAANSTCGFDSGPSSDQYSVAISVAATTTSNGSVALGSPLVCNFSYN